MNFNAVYVFLSLFLTVHIALSEEIKDSLFLIELNVDSRWKYQEIDSSCRYIYDETKILHSYIYIERMPINQSIVLKDDEYAQLYFLSNLTIAKNFGAIQYYDTSSSIKQGDLRAYELFAFYFDDSLNGKRISWAELGRWCKSGNYVYQITVLGDTSDVLSNLSQYKTVVNSITIMSTQNSCIKLRPQLIINQQNNASSIITNLIGRKINESVLKRTHTVSEGVYISKKKKMLIILSK